MAVWPQTESGVAADSAMPAMGLSDPTQAAVEASMDALADRTRLADGVPTSLADLGFRRAPLPAALPTR